MSTDVIRGQILDALAEVAPEADPDRLRGDVALRDQLDIDSMDFLNFLIGVAARTGVEVPERDYAAVQTLDDCIGYVARVSDGS